MICSSWSHYKLPMSFLIMKEWLYLARVLEESTENFLLACQATNTRRRTNHKVCNWIHGSVDWGQETETAQPMKQWQRLDCTLIDRLPLQSVQCRYRVYCTCTTTCITLFRLLPTVYHEYVYCISVYIHPSRPINSISLSHGTHKTR